MHIVNNTHCYECHRAVTVVVVMGEQDEHGHIDQESGGAFCVDCLLGAIALTQDDGKDDTPPGALEVSLRRERLRRLEREAAEAEAAALRARVAELEAARQFRPPTEPPAEAGEYAVIVHGRTQAARYNPDDVDADGHWPWTDFDGEFVPIDGWRPL